MGLKTFKEISEDVHERPSQAIAKKTRRNWSLVIKFRESSKDRCESLSYAIDLTTFNQIQHLFSNKYLIFVFFFLISHVLSTKTTEFRKNRFTKHMFAWN